MVQLEERVSKVKTRYSVALRNLEQISEQIHAQRGRRRFAAGQTNACGGRSSPVGAESDCETGGQGGACGGGARVKDWADGTRGGDKTREWVERHRATGWGEKERAEAAEKAGSDTLSVLSLQTIASDLEKCDSVEHLGDFLSDVVSLSGEEGEKERRVRVEERAAGRGAPGPAGQDVTSGETQTAGRESFVKQHHRSVSL